MSRIVTFRCIGRRERGAHHHIEVRNGIPTCSCQGTNWCSHIDATLLCGERHMVPAEDRASADLAASLLSSSVRPPADWQATWRLDKVWTGASAARSDEAARIRIDGRPTICFIGSGPSGNRAEYTELAQSLGWRVVGSPSALTTLVVSDQTVRPSSAKDMVSKHRLTTITHSQWDEWCYDITNVVMDKIEELLAA